MNIQDLSTRKLKKHYLTSVKRYWRRKDNPYKLCKADRKEAWDYLQAIKSELAERGWYV